MKKFIKDHRGQALVEFALVLPILVLLLLMIMEGGRIFASYLELESACRDGARYASIHKDVVFPSDLSPWVNNRLSLLDPLNLQITEFTREESSDKKDMWVEVTLQYPLAITTPLISDIIGNPFNLTTHMAMRVE